MSLPAEVLGGAGPLARRLHHDHNRLWAARVDDQLTGPQYSVLAVLLDRTDADHTRLSSLTHLDKSTLTPLLARLEQRGLIAISPDAHDRRRRIVSITDAGATLVDELSPAAAEVGRDLLGALTTKEQDDLLRLLRKAVDGAANGQGDNTIDHD
ncbi:MarR family transcriptional regulator [Brevibacterium sanguinis]|uniref:MarR family transcriptional regulator n=2 Tax=Brevibacterium TaxID=1696 RepID=A0A366ILT4_9MICO|nr:MULTISPECIES: MarR family winged helix-turn-helix transcriptional regulator [Brevibacterium]RBP67171.1 MarR family transcriptional regulator [Brevibacterium sanguinis]RBP73696.1 MarR family transcriptional regulator [Brevibacterium celere]